MKYDKENNNYIIRTSNNQLYHFILENKNLIMNTLENNEHYIIKHDIDEFSLDIDENDIIHVVYLSENKLKYSNYPTISQDTTLLSTNERFSIKELSIKIIESSIHIFYILNKLELNLSFIYHSYFYDNHWNHIQIGDLNCQKYAKSYHIDRYNNEMYLLYGKNNYLNELIINKFSLINRAWSNFDSSIYINDIASLHFLITDDHNGILCFNQSINKNLQVMVRYKNFDNPSADWSSNINVSMNNANSVRPKAFLKDRTLHIIWTQGDTIVYKKSQNLLNWENECIIYARSTKYYSTYISNNKEDKDYKMYNIHTDFIFSHINMVNYNNQSKKNNKNYVVPASENTSLDLIDYSKLIQELLDEIASKEKEKQQLLKSLQNERMSYSKKLNILHEILENYMINLSQQKDETINEIKKLSEKILEYEHKLESLKQENENLLINTNTKIQNLLKIIQEKNTLIQNLYKLINNANH